MVLHFSVIFLAIYLLSQMRAVQSQFYKKDGHWVKIPCPEIYHCDVDVCKALGKETSCAFNTGLFVRPEHEYVHSSSIPSGDYYGELHFFSSGQHVGCVRVYYEVIGA